MVCPLPKFRCMHETWRLTVPSRRSKIKCTGTRPHCHACRKRKVICSWPKTLIPGNYHAVDSFEIESALQNQKRVQIVPSVVTTAESNAFPKDPLIQRLLNIFLTRHHDVEFCSFFHKPSINVSELSVKSPFLVASILSLSSLYIPENEARTSFGFESAAVLSDHYVQLARSYAKSLSDEPLCA